MFVDLYNLFNLYTYLLLGIGSYSMDIHNCTLTDQVQGSSNITSTTAHVEANIDN